LFLKVLDIKKMFVKGEQNIEIAPILITANNKQLTLKITGQSLNLGVLESNTSKVDIIVPRLVGKFNIRCDR
jgi:hypothetical protein